MVMAQTVMPWEVDVYGDRCVSNNKKGKLGKYLKQCQ